MGVQSLNGDSYQGAQVGANVQSQVGTQPMCHQVNALESKSPRSYWHLRVLSRERGRESEGEGERGGEREREEEERERGRERGKCRNKILPTTKPNQNRDNHGLGEPRPHFVNAFGSGLSATLGKQERSKHRRGDQGPSGTWNQHILPSLKGKEGSSVPCLTLRVSLLFVGFPHSIFAK